MLVSYLVGEAMGLPLNQLHFESLKEETIDVGNLLYLLLNLRQTAESTSTIQFRNFNRDLIKGLVHLRHVNEFIELVSICTELGRRSTAGASLILSEVLIEDLVDEAGLRGTRAFDVNGKLLKLIRNFIFVDDTLHNR